MYFCIRNITTNVDVVDVAKCVFKKRKCSRTYFLQVFESIIMNVHNQSMSVVIHNILIRLRLL